MRAIIVADGDVAPRDQLAWVLPTLTERDSVLVIAADGGALKAINLGLRPDVVVGDADSLASEQVEELRASGSEVIVYPPEKEESDTELAVREAVRRGAHQIVVLGAFGGERVEHTIANLLLLGLPELAGRDAVLVDGPSTVRVIGAAGSRELEIRGAPADFVSLLPLSERVARVSTMGLRYPLADATLDQGPARGLSNELSGSVGSVTVGDGRLAVVHTRRSALAESAGTGRGKFRARVGGQRR